MNSNKVCSNRMTMVIWGEPNISLYFLSRLQRVLGEALFKCCSEPTLSRKNMQQNHSERIEWSYPSALHQLIMARLSIGRRRYGWYYRSHVPKSQRGVSNIRSGTHFSVARSNIASIEKEFRVAGWNINGLRTKIGRVQQFLASRDIDVLAIQESTLDPNFPILRIPGYRVLEVRGPGPQCASDRGVAILVRKKFKVKILSGSSPRSLLVKLQGPTEGTLIVGSQYIPQDSEAKKIETNRFKNLIWNLSAKYHDVPIVIMGDFICGRRDMLKLVSETSSFRVPPVPQTTSRLRGRKVIDHCVLQDGIGLTLRASDVLTTELASDHYPVLSTFGHQPTEKYNTCEWKLTPFVPNRMGSADFGNHEKFAPLQKSCRFAIVDEIDSSMETAEGRSLYKSYAETKSPKRLRIPKDVVRRLRKQRMIGAKIVNAKGPQKERLLQLWKGSHKWCSKRIREEEKSRLLYRHELAFQALTTDPRKFFRYSKDQMGNRRNLEEVYIKHPVTEELTDDPDTNQAAWTAYTEHLLKESSAPARDPEHWEQAFQQIERSTHELDNADEAPSDNELLFAIAALKSQKAAGIDGVPAEIFKAMALGNRNNSPAWRELCVALRAILVLGHIPESQMTSLLVFMHKKGSKTDASNHRGISLMPVFFKILCKVVERRISEHLESRGFFHKEQAGFRKLEECPVQVFTLVEACQRRLYNSHENTYLGFVDLRKAYDSVPHEGLFRKLYLYGIRGKTLSFLRALYASSMVKVRTGVPGEYRISESIKVQRGLRQGCPLSPVLFNIYFNDVIRQYKGVAIPHERGKVLISHLMFADDLVILGESPSGFQSAMDELTGWLNKNNMKANASKCGVLRVTLNTSEPFNRPVMVDGEEIPYVRNYKYLGVNLDQSLS
eukprot:augustus_masked-scaffold_30-processed-gene-3.7-mRNA-1 protein AED:1.00 eAED:1.00 QI:0/0/0/0/1/1/2/0/892